MSASSNPTFNPIACNAHARFTAAEMGEAVRGSEHYYALFAIGIVLFIISFAINFTADLFLNRGRKR